MYGNYLYLALELGLTKYEPSDQLKDFVLMYYTIQSGALGESSVLFNNHPQGTLDIMFALEGHINYSAGASNENVELQDIFTIGQQEQNFKISFHPNTHILGVVFKAESFSRLFNLPVSELTNQGLEITAELGTDYENLLASLREGKNTRGRIQLLEAFIWNRLRQMDERGDQFDKLLHYLRANAGTVPITELASEANMSIRTLQRRMTERIGLGPKSYSKILRFNYAMSMINHHPEMDWHDILFKCGYYDQMHFIKDFKQYTGQSPTQFVKGNTSFATFFRER